MFDGKLSHLQTWLPMAGCVCVCVYLGVHACHLFIAWGGCVTADVLKTQGEGERFTAMLETCRREVMEETACTVSSNYYI